MKKAIFFVFILFSFSTSAQAAFDNSFSSAKTLSLGNASVAMTDELSTILSNPGSLGFLQNKGFQASFSRLFDLDELSEKEFYVAFPYGSFSLGAGFYMFGKRDYYQESLLSFAFSYRIREHLSLGSNLKYMRVSFSSEYDALSTFSIDLGSTYKINNRFQVGFVAKNLNQPELVKSSDDISTNFSFGLAVFPFDEVTLLLDLTYEERHKEQLHLGQEIKLLENIPLRFGIQTSPARYAFGAGFNFDKLAFDYAYLNHSVLGDTHKFRFSYLWGSKK
ncbi:MAG: hypothetical protein AMJ91_00635 [candidate division Zixibacteria bacterium SM23_73_3]|nr:MAG: hypothetical protein AMJ91_00635 [candidate division Zixibacteria bacterium SM23_73_3]